MRPYEIMVILDPTLDERTVAPSLDTFLNVIRSDGGSVDKVDIQPPPVGLRNCETRRRHLCRRRRQSHAGHRFRARPSAESERVGAANKGDARRQALISPVREIS